MTEINSNCVWPLVIATSIGHRTCTVGGVKHKTETKATKEKQQQQQ